MRGTSPFVRASHAESAGSVIGSCRTDAPTKRTLLGINALRYSPSSAG